MNLGERIKKIRVEKNITQDELAKKLNISRQSISKWENSINEPDIETLKQLCIIFDCEIEDIIGYVREPIRQKNRAFKVLLRISFSLCVFSLLITTGMIAFMPNEIPMHYDQTMVPDRYGTKYEMFFISLIYLIPLFLIFVSSAIDKYICDYDNFKLKKLFKKPSDAAIEGYKPSSSVTMGTITLIVTLIISVMNFVFSVIVLKDVENYLINLIYMILSVFFGIVSVFSSPLYNKEVNFIFGFRTRFSLSNKENWIKLNMCQSISAGLCAIILYISSLFIRQEILIYFIFLLIVSIFPTIIYQIILIHKNKRILKK